MVSQEDLDIFNSDDFQERSKAWEAEIAYQEQKLHMKYEKIAEIIANKLKEIK